MAPVHFSIKMCISSQTLHCNVAGCPHQLWKMSFQMSLVYCVLGSPHQLWKMPLQVSLVYCVPGCPHQLCKMPFQVRLVCCVPGCPGRPRDDSDKHFNIHPVPWNPDLRQAWVRAITSICGDKYLVCS